MRVSSQNSHSAGAFSHSACVFSKQTFCVCILKTDILRASSQNSHSACVFSKQSFCSLCSNSWIKYLLILRHVCSSGVLCSRVLCLLASLARLAFLLTTRVVLTIRCLCWCILVDNIASLLQFIVLLVVRWFSVDVVTSQERLTVLKAVQSLCSRVIACPCCTFDVG